MRTRLVALPLLLATMPAMSGCAALTGQEGEGDGGPAVVAAFYPLQWVAEQVTGGPVASLTSPGGEPHDLELGVRETAELAEADLLVVLSGFQPAVDDAAEQTAGGVVLDAAEAVDLMPFAEHEHGDEHGDDEHGHDHGDDEHDPHFWLDPLRMAELGDALAGELADLDPEQADEYRDRATALRSDLEQLDADYAAGLADCEVDTVVTNHDAFGYLAKYGLHLESIAGISPDAEPTPAALAALHRLIEEEGVTTVFSESLVSPATAETLARDAGVETGVLDTVEGLSDVTADDDYVSLMRANLEALQEANRC